jgi:hypothetical protein
MLYIFVMNIEYSSHFNFVGSSIMDREKRLSILYQMRGRATQFANKAARDKWLRREIEDLEPVLSSNRKQVVSQWLLCFSFLAFVFMYYFAYLN